LWRTDQWHDEERRTQCVVGAAEDPAPAHQRPGGSGGCRLRGPHAADEHRAAHRLELRSPAARFIELLGRLIQLVVGRRRPFEQFVELLVCEQFVLGQFLEFVGLIQFVEFVELLELLEFVELGIVLQQFVGELDEWRQLVL
jgi:hypothetical protein